MKRITVYCGSSSGVESQYKTSAMELGRALAKKNITLVYGGAHVGLMGAVADGALLENGKVIGILPQFLAAKELQHTQLTESIIVDTMHERKAKMYELADGYIALPGGFGTMEELFEMLTWAQLSLHKNPIGLLNIDGYYDSLLTLIQTMHNKGFLKPEYLDLLIVSDNIDALLEQMHTYIPPQNEKWFEVI